MHDLNLLAVVSLTGCWAAVSQDRPDLPDMAGAVAVVKGAYIPVWAISRPESTAAANAA
jgi:hypothetical protein